MALADGALTYLNTPDLKYEGNPLVAKLGLGWEALFLANALFFVLYAAGAYYAFVKYKTPPMDVKNRKEFFSGYAYACTAPIARIILVSEWLMSTFQIRWVLYYRIQRRLPLHRMDLAVSLIVLAALIIYWHFREYRIIRESLPDSAKDKP